ncbi:DUF4124 domain-containing protein [Chitinimonas lacunae]|uniref:DUF4124 domain-containing protein n=1 Tax=Chitinimonas lacunae TaxID=1963018 RepID=A0ABV8MQ39_9NEIS
MQTKFTHLFLTVLLSLPAVAGVNKCIGNDGKVTYSQTPCPSTSKSAEQVRIVDNAIVDGQRLRAQASQMQGSQTEPGVNARKSAKGIDERAEELERLRVEACRKMVEEPKKMGDFTRAYRACQVLSGQVGEVEQPANAPMKTPQAVHMPPSPITFTHCNGSGCFDNVGQFYRRSGNAYVGTNGCMVVGGMLQCP